jgi:hypothetical protein
VWSPGETLIIDWGVEHGLHAFCAVLAWSRFRFVRFAADERAATTLGLLADCFEALGGVPKTVLAEPRRQRRRHQALPGGLTFSVGFPATDPVAQAIELVPSAAWGPGLRRGRAAARGRPAAADRRRGLADHPVRHQHHRRTAGRPRAPAPPAGPGRGPHPRPEGLRVAQFAAARSGPVPVWRSWYWLRPTLLSWTQTWRCTTPRPGGGNPSGCGCGCWPSPEGWSVAADEPGSSWPAPSKWAPLVVIGVKSLQALSET